MPSIITWKTVDWLRSITSLPIVLKGILTAEDATLAATCGIDGIIVSNHGGRQLDGVMPAIEASLKLSRQARDDARGIWMGAYVVAPMY